MNSYSRFSFREEYQSIRGSKQTVSSRKTKTDWNSIIQEDADQYEDVKMI